MSGAKHCPLTLDSHKFSLEYPYFTIYFFLKFKTPQLRVQAVDLVWLPGWQWPNERLMLALHTRLQACDNFLFSKIIASTSASFVFFFLPVHRFLIFYHAEKSHLKEKRGKINKYLSTHYLPDVLIKAVGSRGHWDKWGAISMGLFDDAVTDCTREGNL